MNQNKLAVNGITPRIGMYVDDQGIQRFLNPGTGVGPGAKRWFNGSVTRQVTDSRDNVVAKNVQKTEVFCLESEVIGFLFARCPVPTLPEGTLKTRVEFGESA